jgi:hypothetical protein
VVGFLLVLGLFTSLGESWCGVVVPERKDDWTHCRVVPWQQRAAATHLGGVALITMVVDAVVLVLHGLLEGLSGGLYVLLGGLDPLVVVRRYHVCLPVESIETISLC